MANKDKNLRLEETADFNPLRGYHLSMERLCRGEQDEAELYTPDVEAALRRGEEVILLTIPMSNYIPALRKPL